jgi:hypothetical protein
LQYRMTHIIKDWFSFDAFKTYQFISFNNGQMVIDYENRSTQITPRKMTQFAKVCGKSLHLVIDGEANVENALRLLEKLDLCCLWLVTSNLLTETFHHILQSLVNQPNLTHLELNQVPDDVCIPDHIQSIKTDCYIKELSNRTGDVWIMYGHDELMELSCKRLRVDGGTCRFTPNPNLEMCVLAESAFIQSGDFSMFPSLKLLSIHKVRNMIVAKSVETMVIGCKVSLVHRGEENQLIHLIVKNTEQSFEDMVKVFPKLEFIANGDQTWGNVTCLSDIS